MTAYVKKGERTILSFSKAFDKMSHVILMFRMPGYKLNKWTVKRWAKKNWLDSEQTAEPKVVLSVKWNPAGNQFLSHQYQHCSLLLLITSLMKGVLLQVWEWYHFGMLFWKGKLLFRGAQQSREMNWWDPCPWQWSSSAAKALGS